MRKGSTRIQSTSNLLLSASADKPLSLVDNMTLPRASSRQRRERRLASENWSTYSQFSVHQRA